MLWGLFLPGWKMVLGLQGGNMVKVLNNSVLTVLFGTTGTQGPSLCFGGPGIVLL